MANDPMPRDALLKACENARQNERRRVSSFRLAWESAFVGVASSTLAIVITTAIWDRQERLAGSIERYNWAPFHDLDGMLMLMPFGYLLYSFVPPGWLFWAGFIVAQTSRRRSPYLLCAAGGAAFGIFWPKHWVAMLGI